MPTSIPTEYYSNDFFLGGEPLLSWPVLKKSIEYSKKHFSPLKINLTTNAILLDADKLEFLRNNNVNLTLSIDGLPSNHNKHRKIKYTNQESFSRILENIERIPLEYRKKISINTVISPDGSYDLMGNFLFIRKLGFINIRPTPVLQAQRWAKKEIINFQEAMEHFSLSYYNLFLDKRKEDIFIIDYLNYLLKTRIVKRREKYYLEDKLEDCNSVWLDLSGEFYVCEALLGVSQNKKCKYRIGDLKKGINLSLRSFFLTKAAASFKKNISEAKLQESDCFLCPLSYFFRGEGFNFYFDILKIYLRSYSNILVNLENNILFRDIYDSFTLDN